MGSVGNFLFGGSKQTSSNSNSSSSTQNSSNQSAQGSLSSSDNSAASQSKGYNSAYAPIDQAMSPTLGYTAAGGNMLGALLGLPGYTPEGGPAVTYAKTAAPTNVNVGQPSHAPTATDLLAMLKAALPTTPTTPTVPPTTTTHPPVGTSTPLPYSRFSVPHIGLPEYARGGPVPAGQPVVVGENQPEVFVPHQPGTIVPQVPGGMVQNMMHPQKVPHVPHGGGGLPVPVPPVTPPVPTVPPVPTAPPVNPQSAMQTWADSAGQKYLMDQGQRAIGTANFAGGFGQSGATMQALQKMGMGLGSTYQNDYINHLLDFSKLGLGGASAMSGAGGINTSGSSSSGGNNSASIGGSVGDSTGTSSSSGSGTGSGSAKNGLLPDLASFAKMAP